MDTDVGAGNRGGVASRCARMGWTAGSAFFFASRHSSRRDFSNGRLRLRSLLLVEASSSPNAVMNSILSFTGVVSTGDTDRDLDLALTAGNLGRSRVK